MSFCCCYKSKILQIKYGGKKEAINEIHWNYKFRSNHQCQMLSLSTLQCRDRPRVCWCLQHRHIRKFTAPVSVLAYGPYLSPPTATDGLWKWKRSLLEAGTPRSGPIPLVAISYIHLQLQSMSNTWQLRKPGKQADPRGQSRLAWYPFPTSSTSRRLKLVKVVAKNKTVLLTKLWQRLTHNFDKRLPNWLSKLLHNQYHRSK